MKEVAVAAVVIPTVIFSIGIIYFTVKDAMLQKKLIDLHKQQMQAGVTDTDSDLLDEELSSSETTK